MDLVSALVFAAIYLIWGFISENRSTKRRKPYVPYTEQVIRSPHLTDKVKESYIRDYEMRAKTEEDRSTVFRLKAILEHEKEKRLTE